MEMSMQLKYGAIKKVYLSVGMYMEKAMPWLKQSDAGFSQQSLGFSSL
jgi:hypothetical protein